MQFLKEHLTSIWLLVAVHACISAAEFWSGDIVFRDEFDGNTLDLNKWEYEEGCTGFGGPNLECYVKDNVEVKNGNLVITAKVQNYQDKNYTSGRIRQKDPGFRYGAYVARMRLPKGKHLWPAFWMLSRTSCKYEELDIMEYRGQVPTGVDMTAHYGRSWDAVVSKGTNKSTPTDLSLDFHEFALLWRPSSLQWYIDQVKYTEQSLEPPERWRNEGSQKIPCGDEIRPFAELNKFIFNMAVGGGGYFHGFGELTVEEARNWEKPTFEIDWVRVYQE